MLALMVTNGTFRLTVGVATRNRPQSLVCRLNSIALVEDLVSESIVVDDSRDPPVGPALRQVSGAVGGKMGLVEQPGAQGPRSVGSERDTPSPLRHPQRLSQ